MSDALTPKTGRYVIAGKQAHCIVGQDGRVRVFYDDLSYTVFNMATFIRWRPEPVEVASPIKGAPHD